MSIIYHHQLLKEKPVEGFCAIVFIIVFIVVALAISSSNQKHEETTRLKAAYDVCLQKLRESPTNALFHEQALDAGRLYANATRDKKGVTLFDETALANDIRAVTANASHGVSNQPMTVSTPVTSSLDERIAALNKLKASGLMSDEEFEQKRKEIIASL